MDELNLAVEILPYQPMFILHNYELVMNLVHTNRVGPCRLDNLNVMNVVYFGDIKTPCCTDNFGIMIVKFVPFAIGGFHAVYSR
jgi:hypothetical protein